MGSPHERSARVTLDVVCPKCEFFLQVQFKMAGRSIRCPNPDCGTIFMVPPPLAEIIAPAKPAPKPKPAPGAPKPKEVRWSDDAEIAAKPKAKEVRWTEEVEQSTVKAPPKPVVRNVPPPPSDDAFAPIRVSKKRRNRSPMILAGLSVTLLMLIVGLGIAFVVSNQREEKRLFAQAEQAYNSGQYSNAHNTFAQLSNNFTSSERQPRYEFFAGLSSVLIQIQQIGASYHPDDTLTAFGKFSENYAEAPLAKPGSGFGADVVQAGQKLASASHDFCLAELQRHRSDRSLMEPLNESGNVSARVRELLAGLERFRDKDSPSSKEILQKFDALDASLAVEQKRAATMADWRVALRDPTHSKIEAFQTAMGTAGLAVDEETVALVAAARKALLSHVRYIAGRSKPVAFPAAVAEPQFSVAPVPGSPKPMKGESTPCFGLNAGCIFALDSSCGELLWARRVTVATANRATFDIPVTVELPVSRLEVALVGFPHGLAALNARTGGVVWYQPLPAPCFARPAVLGNRVFVGLLDEAGTIVDLDLATGERLGSIALQQPLGANLQIHTGEGIGPGLLMAVCDSQRAMLFAPRFGNAPSLDCVRSIFTDHAPSAVLVDPLVFVGSSPRLFLMQAAGASASKLVEYRLPATNELAASKLDGDWPAPRAMEKPFLGWPWYPMRCDGERLAIATDAGTISLSGLNASGSGIFALLPESTKLNGETVSRACIAAMGEDSLWAVAGQELVEFQMAVGPQGFRMVPVGKPRRIGEAAARSQFMGSINLAVVSVKPTELAGIQLYAFDPDTGECRWNVQLNVGSK